MDAKIIQLKSKKKINLDNKDLPNLELNVLDILTGLDDLLKNPESFLIKKKREMGM